MGKNGDIGSQIFWDILNSSAGLAILSGADLILLILAFIFVVVGSIRLHKNMNAVGTRYILVALITFVFGLIIYGGYLLVAEEFGNPLIEAFFGFYASACAAAGAYGLLRLGGSLKNKS